MSRSGYCDDMEDQWAHIRWRGAVTAAIRGKRGQALFRDLVDALDNLPEKKLIANELEGVDGCVCALGAVGRKREVDMSRLEPDDSLAVSHAFDISDALAREIVFENDEAGHYKETPEQRFIRIRRWAVRQIKSEAAA